MFSGRADNALRELVDLRVIVFLCAYSCCASTYPRQMAIASSSFAPMRRLRISSRPTLVSNDHLPLFLTIGIGTGSSSFPIVTMARFLFLGSVPTSVFSFALATKAMARFLSATASSE